MGSYAQDTDGRSLKSLLASVMVHVGLLLAVSLSPPPEMFPEGTDSITVDFEALPAPKGNQVRTKSVGPIESKVPEVGEPEPPASVPMPEANAVEVVETPPPPKPEKPKVAKAPEPKPQPKPVEKPMATETVEDSDVAVDLPEKKAEPVEEAEPTIAETEAQEPVEEVAQTSDDGENELEEEVERQEQEAQKLAAAAAMLEEQSKAQEELNKLPKKANEAKSSGSQAQTASSGSGEKVSQKGLPGESSGKTYRSDLPFGVPTGVRDVKDLSQVPGNVPPQYPTQARLRKQQGTVRLLYFVTQDGRVTNMKLMESSGHPVLDNEAVRAIAKYRFRPGQAGYTKHKVVFSLYGDSQEAGGRLRTSSVPSNNPNRQFN